MNTKEKLNESFCWTTANVSLNEDILVEDIEYYVSLPKMKTNSYIFKASRYPVASIFFYVCKTCFWAAISYRKNKREKKKVKLSAKSLGS